MKPATLLLTLLFAPLMALATDSPPPRVNSVLSAAEQAALTPDNIRQRSPIIAGLEQAGDIKIIGAIYNMHTGVVHKLD